MTKKKTRQTHRIRPAGFVYSNKKHFFDTVTEHQAQQQRKKKRR